MREDLPAEQDRDLVQRMASKDVNALDAFYERHNALVFSFAFRIVENRSTAEDILLEVFWQAWKESSKYDAALGTPVTWLLTIARARALETRISKRPFRPAILEASRGNKSEIAQAAQEALEALSEQQRIPLEMAYFQGMSHTQIASSLNLPVETVKEHIRTGMLHPRGRLKTYL